MTELTGGQAAVDALEAEGVLDNTILIVTSDNGSFMYRLGDEEEDHVDDATVQDDGRVQVREGGGRTWIADVVGRHVDRLDRGD